MKTNNQRTMVADGLVKPSEAAKILGICRAKLYNLMGSGELQSLKIGRARRIPRGALVDFMAERLGA